MPRELGDYPKTLGEFRSASFLVAFSAVLQLFQLDMVVAVVSF